MKTKERVKKGELSPEAALALLKRDPLCPPKTLKWVDTVGRKRFKAFNEQIELSKEIIAEIVEEEKKSESTEQD